MKKALLVLSLVVFIIPLLGSCKFNNSFAEPDSVEKLWEKIDGKMNSLNSYRTDISAEISVTVNDVEIESSTDGYGIISGLGEEGELYVYETVETTVNSSSSDISETTTNLLAYSDGKMLVLNKLGDTSNKLYSNISDDEFMEYYKSENYIDPSPENCSKSEFSKNGDGSWNLRFSEFDGAEVKELISAIGFDDPTLGIEINDVSVAVQADKEYRVTEMSIDFLVGEAEKSALSITLSYSQFDCAEKVSIDFSEYKLVDDARVLGIIDRSLRYMRDSENGAFSLVLSNELSTKNGQVLSDYSYKETDHVSFSERDGKYVYSINAKISAAKLADQAVDMNYENGKQIVSIGGRSQQKDQTEAEARAFITGLMNPIGYSKLYVRDIEKVKDGVYNIRCEINDTTDYKKIMLSYGDTYKSHVWFVTVTLGDDHLVKIESNLVISGIRYDYTVKGNVTFQ